MAATATIIVTLAAVLAAAAVPLVASAPDHEAPFSAPTRSYGPPARTLQQSGACGCLRKQILGNCGPICACLEAMRLPTMPRGSCLPVCQSCDRVLRASGCPPGGRLPAACLMPMQYAPQVQRCRAVANRRC